MFKLCLSNGVRLEAIPLSRNNVGTTRSKIAQWVFVQPNFRPMTYGQRFGAMVILKQGGFPIVQVQRLQNAEGYNYLDLDVIQGQAILPEALRCSGIREAITQIAAQAPELEVFTIANFASP